MCVNPPRKIVPQQKNNLLLFEIGLLKTKVPPFRKLLTFSKIDVIGTGVYYFYAIHPACFLPSVGVNVLGAECNSVGKLESVERTHCCCFSLVDSEKNKE